MAGGSVVGRNELSELGAGPFSCLGHWSLMRVILSERLNLLRNFLVIMAQFSSKLWDQWDHGTTFWTKNIIYRVFLHT